MKRIECMRRSDEMNNKSQERILINEPKTMS